MFFWGIGGGGCVGGRGHVRWRRGRVCVRPREDNVVSL